MKKMLLLLVSGLLILSLTGIAMASPAEIRLFDGSSEVDSSISVDTTNVKDIGVRVYAIDYDPLYVIGSTPTLSSYGPGNPHSRTITVTTSGYVKARIKVGGTTTSWTGSSNSYAVTYTYTASSADDFTSLIPGTSSVGNQWYHVELQGTGVGAGQVTIKDSSGQYINSFTDADHDGLEYNEANYVIDVGDTTRDTNSIPEFPTVALPIASVIGLLFVFGRKKEGL